MGTRGSIDHIKKLVVEKKNPEATEIVKWPMLLDGHLSKGMSCLEDYAEIVRKLNAPLSQDEYKALKQQVEGLMKRLDDGHVSNLALVVNSGRVGHAVSDGLKDAGSTISFFCRDFLKTNEPFEARELVSWQSDARRDSYLDAYKPFARIRSDVGL
jgi:hypothetical protein